jgi:hypothetical protein
MSAKIVSDSGRVQGFDNNYGFLLEKDQQLKEILKMIKLK